MTVNGLERYRTLVFDCDGVILDSNGIKSGAFHEVASRFGPVVADRFLEHHRRFGGVSRYVKFAHLLEEMVGVPADRATMEELLDEYACSVRRGHRRCEINPSLGALRAATVDARWMVVSGGDQDELREVFAERGLEAMFQGGIFGSPESKDVILEREAAGGCLVAPGLFIGDSLYDHEAATNAGLDFVFVEQWTEVPGWEAEATRLGFDSVARLGDLLGRGP